VITSVAAPGDTNRSGVTVEAHIDHTCVSCIVRRPTYSECSISVLLFNKALWLATWRRKTGFTYATYTLSQ